MSLPVFEKNLGERAFDSAAMVVGASVLKQVIGLASMILLARLLTPSDYGIVALSTLIIYFFDLFSQIGIKQYILSRPTLKDNELHTAWSLQLLIRIGLALTVISLSQVIADYFDEQDLVAVLVVSSFIPIINSSQAPGLLLLRRNFDYRLIAFITVVTKFVASIVAITVAYIFQNYWAFVVGDLTLAVLFSVLSYKAHPLKPKVSFKGWREQWSFSKWILARAFVGFMRAKVDNLLIGKALGIEQLGVYSISKQLSTLPHEHITNSLVDLFTSSISRVDGNLTEAGETLSKFLVVLFGVLFPISIGLYLFAEPLVEVLLGREWQEASAIIEALASLAITLSLSSVVSTALVALSRVRQVFAIDFLTSIVVVLSLLYLTLKGLSLVELAWFRSLLAVLVFLTFYVSASMIIPVPHRRLIFSLFPAIVAAILMFISIVAFQESMDVSVGILDLILLFIVGLLSYLLSYYMITFLSASLTPELKFAYETLKKMTNRLQLFIPIIKLVSWKPK